ncbi:MAG: metallophosphoesterase family protein [Lentisphaerae bacterium]|jgi:diadenosine tetraphosphatase ApaH/serine/threonine PP2A family protein phosphatase|nr:metallophosphoesterase family protein [Lentisphaerota bacterium]
MEKSFAILGDIHSNIDALRAVIDDARSQSVTDFLCVGDVVGYNAAPAECISVIRDELNAVTVRGNHDHYCSHDARLDDFQPLAASVIDWTRRQLSSDDATWLRDLPLQKLSMGIGLVHSTLDMPGRWGYVFDLLDAEAHFSYQATTISFHGHTHVPLTFVKQGADVYRYDPSNLQLVIGTKYFINVGSVGQPRDGDPRSSYVIFKPRSRVAEFRRIEYDVETAMERNRLANLPDRLIKRLAAGR